MAISDTLQSTNKLPQYKVCLFFIAEFFVPALTGTLDSQKVLTVLARLGLLVYWTYDHLSFLAKFKAMNGDAGSYSITSARG